jgi:hypothetical protein
VKKNKDMSKANEISELKNNQLKLRKEIKSIKNKLPRFFVSFVLITVCSLYFLESRVYRFFGNAVNFMMFGAFLSTVIFLIYLYTNYVKIQSKEKEVKLISGKLYKLMRLKKHTINE